VSRRAIGRAVALQRRDFFVFFLYHSAVSGLFSWMFAQCFSVWVPAERSTFAALVLVLF